MWGQVSAFVNSDDELIATIPWKLEPIPAKKKQKLFVNSDAMPRRRHTKGWNKRPLEQESSKMPVCEDETEKMLITPNADEPSEENIDPSAMLLDEDLAQPFLSSQSFCLPAFIDINGPSSSAEIASETSAMMDLDREEVTAPQQIPAFRLGARDPSLLDYGRESPPEAPVSMMIDEMISDESEYYSTPPEKTEIDILEIESESLEEDQKEPPVPGRWFQTARILQRLENELPSKYG
ncbi:hypothetical protein HDU96_004332, partial [Phlyctochytrium bullatum]